MRACWSTCRGRRGERGGQTRGRRAVGRPALRNWVGPPGVIPGDRRAAPGQISPGGRHEDQRASPLTGGTLEAVRAAAMLVAVAALFVALGSVGYAAHHHRVGRSETTAALQSVDVKNDDLLSRDIHDGTILSRDVTDDTILSRDVQDDTLLQRDIDPEALTAFKGPRAFAHVTDSLGGSVRVDEANSKGIVQANVSNPSTGLYCFDNLGFNPKIAIATPISERRPRTRGRRGARLRGSLRGLPRRRPDRVRGPHALLERTARRRLLRHVRVAAGGQPNERGYLRAIGRVSSTLSSPPFAETTSARARRACSSRLRATAGAHDDRRGSTARGGLSAAT